MPRLQSLSQKTHSLLAATAQPVRSNWSTIQRTGISGPPSLENPSLASVHNALLGLQRLLVEAIHWCSQASFPTGVASLGLQDAPISGHSTQCRTRQVMGCLEGACHVPHDEGSVHVFVCYFRNQQIFLKCAYVGTFFLMFPS